MGKRESFLEFFDNLVAQTQVVMPSEVQEFYEALKAQAEAEANKPLFTDIGLQILEYLQSTSSKNLKAKDIADGMVVSSRQVSGAIRKLVSDGYVDKLGSNPVIYKITTKGKEFNIEQYKERLNNESND